jgi:hypothetical protein
LCRLYTSPVIIHTRLQPAVFPCIIFHPYHIFHPCPWCLSEDWYFEKWELFS